MEPYFRIYTDEIYNDFKSIDSSNYHEIVRFCHDQDDRLDHLEMPYFLEVKVMLATAYFELGRYHKFLELADFLLEFTIYHNIQTFQGEDIFQKILFKKAAALYQLLHLSQAEKILWELLKMDPDNAAASYLLKRCLIKNQPGYLRRVKGLSIFLFLLAAATIAVELLLIRPFMQAYVDTVEITRIVIILGGLFILFLTDGWHRFRSFHKVNQAADNLKTKKKSKEFIEV